MRADSTPSIGQRLLLPRGRVEQRPFARRHRDRGQLLARRAVLVHVARGGERIGARRQERPERRLVRIDLAHRGLLAADAALGAAIGDDRDVAEPELRSPPGMRDVELERRAADDRGAEEWRRDPEIFGERQDRQCGSASWRRTGRRRPSAPSPQSASARWMPCAIRSMALMPSATWPRSDSATPTIAAAAALQALHHAPSTGTKTG